MFAYIQTVDCAYSLTPGSKTMLISAGNNRSGDGEILKFHKLIGPEKCRIQQPTADSDSLPAITTNGIY